ncbi:MAG TPA: FUSC family protein [Acidimicrobiales bacterium]
MATRPARGRGSRIRRLRERLLGEVSWTRPTSTEIGTVAKSGLAAGLSWWIARAVSDVPDPVLAPLTAVVVVQVSVRASVRTALQRSAAVVLGVLLALAIGDALELNGLTVALLVAVSLGVAQLVLRLPPSAARQVPISGLVVLSAVAASPESSGGRRAVDTVLGAAVGVAVSLVLPASRLVDARQTVERLTASLGGVLETMGSGLQQRWSTDQTGDWRRTARTVRDRLVGQATEAVGNGREAARWNVRDRRHVEVLGRYEDVMPRLERTAIGVSVISRGLDDHARLSGTTHRAMPAMGALLVALGGAVRALVQDMLGESEAAHLAGSLAEVRVRRELCVQGASRRARSAIEHDEALDGDELEGEWLSYAALLVQVDRIVGDLSAPLPA